MDIARNAEISDYEVSPTFRRGSNTTGPDGTSATMIDEADRDLIHSCLRLLWNKSWASGEFVSDWKEENSIVIYKPGKDDYHECNAYRTISITSCLGKRFEHITSQRLISILTEGYFDKDKFAYITRESSTWAILTVVETMKKSLLYGHSVGAVFFADTFGSVDRACLLHKIHMDFGITGHLYDHISSFLEWKNCTYKDRQVDWRLAGVWLWHISWHAFRTFVVHFHDIPKCIRPKYADDLVVVSTAHNVLEIESDLQEATNQLVQWAWYNGTWYNEGMVINVAKIKVMVMLFGECQH